MGAVGGGGGARAPGGGVSGGGTRSRALSVDGRIGEGDDAGLAQRQILEPGSGGELEAAVIVVDERALGGRRDDRVCDRSGIVVAVDIVAEKVSGHGGAI